MKHFLIKLFSTKELWKEILDREGFNEPERTIEVSSIWSDVYHKSPLLSEFFKKREIDLLKRSTLRDVSSDFILGQIAENRLWQSYDVVPKKATEVGAAPVKEVNSLNKNTFIKNWSSLKTK